MILTVGKSFLAIAVIYSHCSILFPDMPTGLMGKYGGYWSVNIFFLLSGYFLSLKYASRKSIRLEDFLERLDRLIPAAIIVSLFVFIFIAHTSELVPWVQAVSVTLKNGFLIFGVDYDIVCSFSCTHMFGSKVNSSIWSMPVELYASLALLFAISIRGFRHVNTGAIILLALMALELIDLYVGKSTPPVAKYSRALSCFALGVFSFYYFARPRKLSNCDFIAALLVAIALLALGRNFSLAALSLILVFEKFPMLRRRLFSALTARRPKLDPAYGAYLIGFPSQQCLFFYFGFDEFWLLFASTAIFSIGWGLISSRFLENGYYFRSFCRA